MPRTNTKGKEMTDYPAKFASPGCVVFGAKNPEIWWKIFGEKYYDPCGSGIEDEGDTCENPATNLDCNWTDNRAGDEKLTDTLIKYSDGKTDFSITITIFFSTGTINIQGKNRCTETWLNEHYPDLLKLYTVRQGLCDDIIPKETCPTLPKATKDESSSNIEKSVKPVTTEESAVDYPTTVNEDHEVQPSDKTELPEKTPIIPRSLNEITNGIVPGFDKTVEIKQKKTGCVTPETSDFSSDDEDEEAVNRTLTKAPSQNLVSSSHKKSLMFSPMERIKQALSKDKENKMLNFPKFRNNVQHSQCMSPTWDNAVSPAIPSNLDTPKMAKDPTVIAETTDTCTQKIVKSTKATSSQTDMVVITNTTSSQTVKQSKSEATQTDSVEEPNSSQCPESTSQL